MPTQNQMAKKVIQVVYQVNSKELVEADKTIKSIEGDAKKADNAVKKFGTDASNAGKQASKSFMDLRGVMDSIVAIGITAYFVSAGKAIFDLGVKQEQLNIAFTTFLGSAAKAKKVIGDLTQFAIVTPFTPEQVNGAAKALLAFGVSGENVIPVLKRLGDVSAGTGKDLTEMAIIFGQIRSTGRLMGQDLLQLINAGFNPLQIISEQTGKSMKTLKEEMEKGLITFEMVDQAFISATSEGGKFFNLMEKQSQSIGGKLSTITGNIEEIAKGIFESNITLIGTFIDKLSSATDVLLNWVKVANSDPNFEAAVKNAESYRIALEKAFAEFEAGKGPDAINKALQENVKETNLWEESVEFLAERVRHTTGEEFQKYNNLLVTEQATVKLLTELTNEYIKKVREFKQPIKELTDEERKLNKEREKNAKAAAEFVSQPSKERQQFIDAFNPFFTIDEEALNKVGEEASKILENQYNIDFQIQKDANDRALQQEVDHQNRIKQIKQDAFNFGVDLIGKLLLRNDDSLSQRLAAEQAYTDNQIALAGDNEKRKEELAIEGKQREDQLRKEQSEKEKQDVVKKILIQGALNAVKALGLPPIPGGNFLAAGLALGMAAAQAAVANAIGFKDGVIDLQGPGTGRSDSIRANLSAGESVITADATSHSKNLLQAIQDRKIDDRVLSKLKVGANGIIANLNDKNIVKAIQDNRAPSLTKEGYALYETIEGTNGFKRKIRSKQINP